MTIHEIQLAVAERFGVPVLDLATNRAGGRSDARPRMLVCWLARRCTSYSLPRIGRCFGGRDHKTVANAVRRIEDMMRTDTGLRRIATEIREALA